jgi:hypothetical protein
MDSFAFLDLVIGLTFIYFILSITCSALLEIISGFFNFRGLLLRRWIMRTFTCEGTDVVGSAILRHQMVSRLKLRNGRFPAKIPGALFASVILDLSSNKDFQILLPEELRRLWDQFPSGSSNDLKKISNQLRKWFRLFQSHLTDHYKSLVRVWLAVISLAIIIPANTDSFRMADWLMNHPDKGEKIAMKAEQIASVFAQDTTGFNLRKLGEIEEQFAKTGIPVGWDTQPEIHGAASWASKIAGLMVTVFCVSMGAPFWYDLLRYLSDLRKKAVKGGRK